MHIVQITQGDNNGFVTVVPAEVKLFPVRSLVAAETQLLELVKAQMTAIDVTVEPVVDGEERSLNTNVSISECDDDGDEYYYIKPVAAPSSTKPVAELVSGEAPVQVTWFLVD